MIPEFVARLRRKVGPNELLWLAGVNAVVLDNSHRVLLQQNSAFQQWSILSGILEPGENPADGICREIWEETSIIASVDRLVSVTVSTTRVYSNGDRAQYLELTFRCTATEGVARVNDDESIAIGWFGIDELPAMDPITYKKIALAMASEPVTWFQSPTWTPSPISLQS